MNKVKFLLKFGRREHIDMFANGGLFCSNAETFWGIEDELKLKGQGDRLEASSMVFAQRMAIHDYNDHSLIAEVGVGNGLVRYEPAKHIPVFCLFAVYENDCCENNDGSLKIKLSDKTKQTIREHFPNADSVAIIWKPLQFLLDVEKTIGCEIKHELVHYFYIDEGLPTSDGRRAMDHQYMMYLVQDVPPVVENGKKTYSFKAEYVYRALLCKDVFFQDEQEYRIVLPKESVSGGRLYPVKYSQALEVLSLDDFFSQV